MCNIRLYVSNFLLMKLMDKKYLLVGVGILIALIYINYKFNNIIIRIYNNLSNIPKLITVAGVLFFLATFFMKKDKKTIDISDNLLDVASMVTGKDLNVVKDIKKSVDNFVPQVTEPQQQIKHKRNVTDKTKKLVGAQQQWKCASCRNTLDETYEVDHIKRLADGGNNEPGNLQALCPNCHRKKTFHEA